MIKANEFQKLTNELKQKQLVKQKMIQEDTKLVEDALNDLYIKVQKNIELGINPPKFTEIPKILEKEVQENLVMEQNYFLDLTVNAHTRIYYDKNDFDSRIKNNKVNIGWSEQDKKITKESSNNRNKETINLKSEKNNAGDNFLDILNYILSRKQNISN